MHGRRRAGRSARRQGARGRERRLLFGIYSGIVPDGIDDLVTDDIDWAGDSTVLLSYIKGRTTAESLILPRRAVRLLEQWLAHSALLRSFAGPEDRRRLWLALSRPGQFTVVTGSGARAAIQRWVVRHQILAQDGRPLKIHRSRIRTTHHAMRDKSTWTGSGRATIDPNHTPAVPDGEPLRPQWVLKQLRRTRSSSRPSGWASIWRAAWRWRAVMTLGERLIQARLASVLGSLRWIFPLFTAVRVQRT